MALTSDDQVVAVMQRQAHMRAAAYDRTEIVDSEVTVLNSTSALYRGTFSRQRERRRRDQPPHSDLSGGRRAAGRRISMLAVHGA